jgi:hypothetical protein
MRAGDAGFPSELEVLGASIFMALESFEEGMLQHRSGPDAGGGAASRDLVDDSAERGYPYGGERARRRIVGAVLGGMAMAAAAVLLLSARGGGGGDAAILYERDDYP